MPAQSLCCNSGGAISRTRDAVRNETPIAILPAPKEETASKLSLEDASGRKTAKALASSVQRRARAVPRWFAICTHNRGPTAAAIPNSIQHSAAGRIPAIKTNYLLLKNIEVSGLQISDYRKRTPDLMAQCMQEIFALYEAGKLKPSPTVTYPLEGFAQAMRDIQDRRVRGRVVLVQKV